MFIFRATSVRSDIYGLRCLEVPLEYLGLFNCESASHFAEIPAKNVSFFLKKVILIIERGLVQRVRLEFFSMGDCRLAAVTVFDYPQNSYLLRAILR